MTTKNQGPVYPNLKPWLLEPYYCKHIAAMTAEGLHSKAAIAEQLAWRDHRIAALVRVIERALVSGQLEKLEDSKPYLSDEPWLPGVRAEDYP